MGKITVVFEVQDGYEGYYAALLRDNPPSLGMKYIKAIYRNGSLRGCDKTVAPYADPQIIYQCTLFADHKGDHEYQAIPATDASQSSI